MHAFALTLFGQGQRLGHGAQPGLGVKQLRRALVHQAFSDVLESNFGILAFLHGRGQCQGHDRRHGEKGLPEQERLIFGVGGEGTSTIDGAPCGPTSQEDRERGGFSGTKAERRPNQDGHEHELKRILMGRMGKGSKNPFTGHEEDEQEEAELESFSTVPLYARTLCPQ